MPTGILVLGVDESIDSTVHQTSAVLSAAPFGLGAVLSAGDQVPRSRTGPTGTGPVPDRVRRVRLCRWSLFSSLK